jgi:phospholipid-binding lipoprotein MlaA
MSAATDRLNPLRAALLATALLLAATGCVSSHTGNSAPAVTPPPAPDPGQAAAAAPEASPAPAAPAADTQPEAAATPPAPEMPAADTASTPADERLAPAPLPPLRDPLEPLNRVFFTFNDKLYFWLLKPVARGYGFIVPEQGRVWVRNAFTNLAMPGRALNCTLQMDFRGAGTELSRFLINSTVGVAGLGDPAARRWNLRPREEDTGQTLGYYGMPPWLYIHWPLLGPSCPRDTLGFVGDSFLDPLTWLVPDLPPRLGIKAGDRVNRTSLGIGQYEEVKEAALDPYTAVRDIYHQYREPRVRRNRAAAAPSAAAPPPGAAR